MRRFSIVLPWACSLLLSSCAPSTRPPAAVAAPPAPPGARPVVATADGRCSMATRRLSARGRGGARPEIAAGADAFAVAWEETSDHRAIRVATFDDGARPLGYSTEVADLRRSGAEPRVVADGNEFLVLWTAEEVEGSTIEARRIDRTGRPLGDIQPLLTAPGARALSVLALPDGYAVAWWNWTGTPHQIAVSFFDRQDRPVGRPVAISHAPSPDPTVDLVADAAHPERWQIAWEELVDGAPHVFTGALDRTRLVERIDRGPGETPELGAGLVVWERPAESALSLAPLAGGEPTSVQLAHTPAATTRPGAGGAACFVRDTTADGGAADELWCGSLSAGQLTAPARVTVEPRGILSLQLAADRTRLGAAWQAQEDDDTRVAFAVVTCRAPASAAVASARARR